MHVQTSKSPPRQGRETCRFGDAAHVILLNTPACYTGRLIQLEKCHNLSLAKDFFVRDYVTSVQ